MAEVRRAARDPKKIDGLLDGPTEYDVYHYPERNAATLRDFRGWEGGKSSKAAVFVTNSIDRAHLHLNVDSGTDSGDAGF